MALNINRKLIAAGFPVCPEVGQEHTHRGTVYVLEACGRCDGTGNYSFNLMHGTTCFQCGGGRGYWRTRADIERRAKRRVTDRARRARKAQEAAAELAAGAADRWADLVERHPLLAELSYRVNTLPGHAYGGILGELLGKFERYGSLSDKQIAFAEKLIREDIAAQAKQDQRLAGHAARPARVNAAIGEEGDRMKFSGTVRRAYETSNAYGPVTLIELDTADGSVKWWATGGWNLERGQELTLQATVKKHETRDGHIFTVVTRGKILN